MKKLLVHSQSDQIRLAIVDDNRLVDFSLHYIGKPKTKSNIYFGKVFRVESGLESLFVDYGVARHGFLPFREVGHFARKDTQVTADDSDSTSDDTDPTRESAVIESPLAVGDTLIVQVIKEERGNKGAALTANISLAGKYLVFMPYGKTSGISRRVSPEDRTRLKQTLAQLTVPENAGVILRTAGASQNQAAIQSDLDSLVRYWQKIQQAASHVKSPALLAEESSFYFSLLRDYISKPTIGAILLDTKEGVEECKNIAESLFESDAHKIAHYDATTPIFEHYGVEAQLAQLFRREVRLPSGGSIVIDPAEALTAVDVNSAQAIRANNIEDTALNTNLEAAAEIANQLRFRDIGGLIVIDFIDMKIANNRKKVIECVEEHTRVDRARIQIGDMSRFGLLEMSRQHLGSALHDMMPIICPHCHGSGRLISDADLADALWQDLLATVRDNADQKQLTVTLALNSAHMFGNSKRAQISALEAEHGVYIHMASDSTFGQQDYTISTLDEQQRPVVLRDTRTLLKHQKEPLRRTKPAVDFRDLKPEPSGFWSWVKTIFVQEEAKKHPLQTKKLHEQRTNARRTQEGGHRQPKRAQEATVRNGHAVHNVANKKEPTRTQTPRKTQTPRNKNRANKSEQPTGMQAHTNVRSTPAQNAVDLESQKKAQQATKTSAQSVSTQPIEPTPVVANAETTSKAANQQPKVTPHNEPKNTTEIVERKEQATAEGVLQHAPQNKRPQRAPNDPRQRKGSNDSHEDNTATLQL